MTGQTRRHLLAAAALTGAWVASKARRAFAGDYDGVRSHPREDHDRDDRPKHCFLRGTLIATPAGERPIETLVAGDKVVTLGSPSTSTIQWVGKYEWDRPHSDKNLVPVRILSGALSPTVPWRDLWLSQHHAIVIGGMLVEVGCLLNGKTIRRPTELKEIPGGEYYHIKLPQHAIILAEGAPCESLRGLSEAACMPLTEYEHTRGAVKSHLRSALAALVDIRQPADVARDQLWTAHDPA